MKELSAQAEVLDESDSDKMNTISIDTYRELVNRCADQRLNYPIANGSALHARILISKLFEIAKKNVCLITGTLRVKDSNNIDIYGYKDVLTTAKRFLSRSDSFLTIIVETGELHQGEENVFLNELKNDDDKQGTIRVIKPNPSVLDFPVAHMMVADASVYRVETSADAKNEHEAITAIANFGDQSVANDLQEYFGGLVNFLCSDSKSTVTDH